MKRHKILYEPLSRARHKIWNEIKVRLFGHLRGRFFGSVLSDEKGIISRSLNSYRGMDYEET